MEELYSELNYFALPVVVNQNIICKYLAMLIEEEAMPVISKMFESDILLLGRS